MGYEIKLLIGRESRDPSRKPLKEKKPVIDGDYLYYPPLKDNDGNIKYSDTFQLYFQVYATIDLCKIGDCNLSAVLKKNENDRLEHYHYGSDGNTEITEDRYGDKPQTASIADCIKALEKDVKESDYRRFKWALSLLKSMNDSSNDMKVLWFGH